MTTLREVLSWPEAVNEEGYVVWIDPFTAVKVKFPGYVELHRIVTGLNRKSVWRALSKGEDEFKALLEQLPDELYAWAEGVAKELRQQYADIMYEVDGWYISTLDEDVWEEDGDDPNPENWVIDRKKFAQTIAPAVPAEYRGFMFAMLDKQYGKVQDKIWRMIEPQGNDK